ncbi:HAD family hydrolase [Pseudomonas sp.]|uniref:HAD family hydrolase n=1 Tax=Pseudomonas sp. TaxID=306 RepID=UPI0028AB6194|nr:HAD hydrolase-like protein [Pseudomonas sp.]
MHKSVKDYGTIVFDCDGVVLDSNKVKTQAFYQAALPYGESEAQALVDFHVANGGISRYKKFDYFSAVILPAPLSKDEVETLLSRYAHYVQDGLLTCKVSEGLRRLRAETSSRWLIVSGGDQAELRHVFNVRGLTDFFEGGIFGSPDTKDEILGREVRSGNITQPTLFIGDSKYDHQASTAAGMDFVYLSGWSEVKGWREWCEMQGITHIPDLAALS